MIGFPECRHERRKKCGCTKAGTQCCKCLECRKTFTDSTLALSGMRIGIAKATQSISMPCEDFTIRATSRLSDTNTATIMELLLTVGRRCKIYLENAIANVPVKDVTVDELRSFVGMKWRTRKVRSKPVGSYGDQ